MRTQRTARGRAGQLEAGFTLIELMVVVLIIGILAAVTLPAMAAGSAERRVAEAALDVVRLARRARAEAVAYGRAHLLRYTTFASGGTANGQVELWRGNSSRCNAVNWRALRTAGGACDTNPLCLDEVDLGSSRYATSGHRVEMRAEGGLGGLVEVCYQPNGAMLWRRGAGRRFFERNVVDGSSLGGGVRLRFEGVRSDGARHGVTRYVLLPLGGEARIVR